MDWTTVFVSVMSFLAVVLSSYAAYKSNIRAKDKELNTMTPQDVRERLDKVEGRVGVLQNEQWEDREYMRRMVSAMLAAGLRLPTPYPAWMATAFNHPQFPQSSETPGSIIVPRPNQNPNPPPGSAGV